MSILDNIPGILGNPGLPGQEPNNQNGAQSGADESPGSFADFGEDAKKAGLEVADSAASAAADEAKDQASDLASDLMEDAKNGKPPNPADIKEKALAAGKEIAHNTGEAAIDAAKEKDEAQVDKALAIISNEFPMLGGILGMLSKPIIERALSECEMPDF